MVIDVVIRDPSNPLVGVCSIKSPENLQNIDVGYPHGCRLPPWMSVTPRACRLPSWMSVTLGDKRVLKTREL